MGPRIILVTGGNRSIGFGTVQALAQRSSENTIVIASRQKANAEKAILELQVMGLEAPFFPLSLDVTDDESIRAAVAEVGREFGKLDGMLETSRQCRTYLTTFIVLINNAGIALAEEDPVDFRSLWTQVMNTNVISVRIICELFLPLLRKSDDPRIINISSLRGSFDRVTKGRNPPVISSPYSTSKAALNMMMLEMASKDPNVTFFAVSPGHCKTAFNGFRGTKHPVDGGTAATELSLAEKGKYEAGFWENEENGMQEVGW